MEQARWVGGKASKTNYGNAKKVWWEHGLCSSEEDLWIAMHFCN